MGKGSMIQEQEERSPSSCPPCVPNGDGEPMPHIRVKTILLVIAVCLTYSAGVANIVAAGAYARDLAAAVGGSEQSTWLSNSVAIMTVVLSPPISEAADLWGRKWFLSGLTFLGCIGCIIVGRANSMGMAIAGQVIAGISYGAQPLVHAVPSEVLPRRVRPVAQAAVNVAAALGSILGLLVGGALTRHNQSGFRIYWYINAGLFALAALLVALLYNPPPRELQIMLTQREKFASLDWLGFLMLSSGLVLFCVSLVWSQNPYPWSNAHILAPFILGLILVLMLIVYESHFKKDGIFHHALFQRGRNFGVALGCIFVEGLVFFTCNNYFAFEVSTLYETDILIVGVRYSLCFIAFAISTCITGVYCSRMKSVRVPAVFAFTLFLAYCITMATATVNSSKAVWGYPILFGTGLGICLNTLMTTAQLGTPPELIATASGLMISVRSLGGSVGLALYNAIFTHTLSTNLASKVPAAVLPLGLPPSSIGLFISDMTSGQQDALSNIPGISGQIIQAGSDAVLDSFSVAFRYVWITAGCFTFIALIAAFFIQDPKAEFNGHIDAPFEPERSLSSHEV